MKKFHLRFQDQDCRNVSVSKMPDMQILGFEIRFLAFMSTLEIVTYICDVSAGRNRNKQILGAQWPHTHTHACTQTRTHSKVTV